MYFRGTNKWLLFCCIGFWFLMQMIITLRTVIKKSLIKKHIKCLNSLEEYGKFCTVFIRRNKMVGSLVTNSVGFDELDVCSIFEDFINCISTQISRCSAPLAESFRKGKLVTLPKICAKREHETGPLSGSVLIHCGVPLATEIQGHMGAVGSSYTMTQVLEYLIDYSCGEIDNYITCLNRYFYQSNNKLDELLQDIVDFSDLHSMKKTLKTVCKSSDRINQRMSCFLQNSTDFEQCGNPSLFTMETEFHNLSLLGEQKARQAFCSDVQSMTSCAVELIGRCDPVLGKLAYKTKNALIKHKNQCGKHGCKHVQSSGSSLGYSFVLNILTLSIIVTSCSIKF